MALGMWLWQSEENGRLMGKKRRSERKVEQSKCVAE